MKTFIVTLADNAIQAKYDLLTPVFLEDDLTNEIGKCQIIEQRGKFFGVMNLTIDVPLSEERYLHFTAWDKMQGAGVTLTSISIKSNPNSKWIKTITESLI